MQLMKDLKKYIVEDRSIDPTDMSVYLTQYVTNEWPTLKQGEDFESIRVENFNFLEVFIQLPCGKGYSSHYREVRLAYTCKQFKYVTKDKLKNENEKVVVDKVVNAIGDYFANRGIRFVKNFEVILAQELD